LLTDLQVISRTIVSSLVIKTLIAASAAGFQPDVEVKIAGEIPAICTIADANGEFEDLAIEREGRARAVMKVSCNAPFNMRLTSHNGAIRTNHDIPLAGFQTSVPYRVSTRLRLDNKSNLRIKNCESGALLDSEPCATQSSNGQTAIDRKLRIDVAWDEPSKPLLAGAYADTIRVTLEPAL